MSLSDVGKGAFDARDFGGENDQSGECVRATAVTELGKEWNFGQKSTISANQAVTTPLLIVGLKRERDLSMRTSELDRMPSGSGWILERAVRSGSKSVFSARKQLKRPNLCDPSSDRAGEWSDRRACSLRRE